MIYGDGAPRIDASQNLRTLGSARVYSVAYGQCTTMASFRIVYKVPEVFVSISCVFSRLCQTWDRSQVALYISLIIGIMFFAATELYDDCTNLNLAKSGPRRIGILLQFCGLSSSIGAGSIRFDYLAPHETVEIECRRLRPVHL
jgi:hypothetical protein